MARDFTPQELVLLRHHLMEARSTEGERQMSHILPVLNMLVDALGESAELTLLARKTFDDGNSGSH